MIKHCLCCGTDYDIMSYSTLEWCGHQIVDPSDPTILELRNCRCGTTLAIETDHQGRLAQDTL